MIQSLIVLATNKHMEATLRSKEMKRLTNDWTEDVNKLDIIQWVTDQLNHVSLKNFGETRIEIIIFPRKWGKK